MYSVTKRIQNVLSFEGFSGRISRKGCYCYQICDSSLHTFYLATVKSIQFLLSLYNMGAQCTINNYRLKILYRLFHIFVSALAKSILEHLYSVKSSLIGRFSFCMSFKRGLPFMGKIFT